MPSPKLVTWIRKWKHFQDVSHSKTGKAPVCPTCSLLQHFLLIRQKGRHCSSFLVRAAGTKDFMLRYISLSLHAWFPGVHPVNYTKYKS